MTYHISFICSAIRLEINDLNQISDVLTFLLSFAILVTEFALIKNENEINMNGALDQEFGHKNGPYYPEPFKLRVSSLIE